MKDSLLSLEDIRAVAEDCVQRHLPDEYPYFGLAWDRMQHPLVVQESKATRKNTSWFTWFLTKGCVRFTKETRMELRFPSIVLMIEAATIELRHAGALASGPKITIPSKDVIHKGLLAWAKVLGVPKDIAVPTSADLASSMHKRITDRLSNDNAREDTVDIGLQVKEAVGDALAPVVEKFDRAALVLTPPGKRQWWQNLRAAYLRQADISEKDKWHAVARIVVCRSLEAGKKPERERQCEYLTPVMLRRLIDRLNRSGEGRTQIVSHCADTLRRYVQRAEKQATLRPARAIVPDNS